MGADRLAVIEAGTGEPLVLIHPVGASAAIWWEVMPLLAQRFRVLAVDLPGHGRSPALRRPLTITDMAESVAMALQERNAAPAHVVGLSIGGMVAQALFGRTPDMVRSLVLVGTASEAPPPAQHHLLEGRAAQVETGGMAAIIDETMARWFSADFHRRRPDAVARVRDMVLACDPSINAEMWRAIIGFTPPDWTAPPPSLVINGELEAKLAPEVGRKLAAAVHGELVEIAGAAHISPVEAPALFSAMVTRFAARA